MVRLTKSNGDVVSFSRSGAGKFFKRLVKRIGSTAKSAVIRFIGFLHEKLSLLEDYLLKKIDNAGTWANKKIDERLPEPAHAPEPTTEEIIE